LPALWPFRWAQEGYELVCNAQGITITALSNAGIFYGIQTVLQAVQVSQEQQALCMPYTRVGRQCPRWQSPIAASARWCYRRPE
jgi:N-acetyl-beta-hexosaminidase